MRHSSAARFAIAVIAFPFTLPACGGDVEAEPPFLGLPPRVTDASLVIGPPIEVREAGVEFDVTVGTEPFDAGFDTGFTEDDAGFDEGGLDAGFDADTFDAGIADSSFDSSGPDGGWLVAPHYAMPTVTNFGGPVVSAPVLTAITFPGYDLTAEAQQFIATIGSTTYWTETVSEYGVGPATAGTPIVLTEAAPDVIDDTAIQTWLATKFATAAGFGTPTTQSIYVVFYPMGTTVTLMGIESCADDGFGGYHNSFTLTAGPWSGQNIVYAVIPECMFDATTAQSLTETTSHELIEATTDPLPLGNDPTYLETDEDDIVWDVILGGGEIADMCAQNANAFFTPTGFTNPVQRVWSNQAALAGHDPCQPSVPGVPYFNAVAQLNATVTLTYEGQPVPTEGLLIPIGSSQTVEVDMYSDGPVGDWSVSADDLSDILGGGPYLSFSWDHNGGTNGSKLHLTITALMAGPLGGQPFEITSSSGALSNYWFGFVGQ